MLQSVLEQPPVTAGRHARMASVCAALARLAGDEPAARDAAASALVALRAYADAADVDALTSARMRTTARELAALPSELWDDPGAVEALTSRLR
ncbi:MAG: hypothetical protein IPM29_27060 [Planctomycetes bacterium]|nr:hypothetical protein [Planctomycetota bacterium]